MLHITPEKAEMLGLLCAEGCHYRYVSRHYEYQPKRQRSFHRVVSKERIEFTNKNEALIQHFQLLVNSCYGYMAKSRKSGSCFKVSIIKKSVIDDILKYTDFGHFKWNVPKEVVKGNINVKAAFVRGFFYGDGSYTNTVKAKRITLWSVNLKGLEQISHMLDSLKIEHHIYSYNPKKPWKTIFNIAIYKRKMLSRFICNILLCAEVAESLKDRQPGMALAC